MRGVTVSAFGLGVAGLSQLGYGVLMGGMSVWALFQFAEGVGLLLAALAVARADRLPTAGLTAGLTLAGLAALPWITAFAGFTGLGPVASFANTVGSFVAAAAVVAWTFPGLPGAVARGGVRLGLGLQSLGGLVWLVTGGASTAWTVAFLLAFAGFGIAAALFPEGEPSPEEALAPAVQKAA